MGHYDFRDELFTKKETEEKIAHIKSLYERTNQKITVLQQDLLVVAHDCTKEVLTDKIDDLERKAENLKRELHNWSVIKERIEKGETLTWEEAMGSASMRTYL